MLPWSTRTNWTVQVWGEEWWECGNSWRSQTGFRIGCWEFFGKAVELVSYRGIGSSAIVSKCFGYLGFYFCFPIETL